MPHSIGPDANSDALTSLYMGSFAGRSRYGPLLPWPNRRQATGCEKVPIGRLSLWLRMGLGVSLGRLLVCFLWRRGRGFGGYRCGPLGRLLGVFPVGPVLASLIAGRVSPGSGIRPVVRRDDSEVMFRVLKVVFCGNPVARRKRVPCQRLIFLDYLMSGSPDLSVRSATLECRVSTVITRATAIAAVIARASRILPLLHPYLLIHRRSAGQSSGAQHMT